MYDLKPTICQGSKLPAVPALQAKDPLEQTLPQCRSQGEKKLVKFPGWLPFKEDRVGRAV